jgi:CheY-like chemotaxis protein
MDIILIAEDDRILSSRLKTYLEKYEDRFDVICADNGKEAVAALDRRKVSLLVTDIQMPEMDGLELLAYVNRHHPVIPCFVMTAYGTPELKKKLPRDLVRFFAKPIDVEKLSLAIFRTLDRKIPRGAVRGISIIHFLQMIVMEKKTCLFEIRRSDNPPGLLFFDNGVLYEASYGKLSGEEAALSVISKDRAEFRFRYFPDKKIPRKIHTDVQDLIQKALDTEEVSEEEWDDIISELI